MKINLVKTNFGLKPVTEEDVEKLKKIEPGEVIEVDIKIPRNAKFHRKFFALLDIMWSNDSLKLTKIRYRKEMLKAAGYYDLYIGVDGNEVKEPHSIAFPNMEQHTFDELYNDMLTIACIRLGVDSGEITKELKETLGKFY
jgi:hypothetical protein